MKLPFLRGGACLCLLRPLWRLDKAHVDAIAPDVRVNLRAELWVWPKLFLDRSHMALMVQSARKIWRKRP